MLLLAVVLTMSGAGQPSSSVDSLADLFGVDEPPAGSDQFLGDMFGCDADDHGAATSVHTAAQVNPGRSTSAHQYQSVAPPDHLVKARMTEMGQWQDV